MHSQIHANQENVQNHMFAIVPQKPAKIKRVKVEVKVQV